MNIVISQPMLFPWVGHLEQVRLSDIFVHYADVQFSKGSFTNRVQIKTAQGSRWMTIPLQGLRLGQRIDEVRIDERNDWRGAHLRMLAESSEGAPYREDMLELVREVYERDFATLAGLAEASLLAICSYYGLVDSRRFEYSHALSVGGSGSERVLGIVNLLGGDTYITGHGASRYLDHERFERAGVRVEYMDYAKTPYPQLHGAFTPYVSSLDLIANVGPSGVSVLNSGTIHWKEFLSNERNRQVPV